MATSLLETLSTETNQLLSCGESSINSLVRSSSLFLKELLALETLLLDSCAPSTLQTLSGSNLESIPQSNPDLQVNDEPKRKSNTVPSFQMQPPLESNSNTLPPQLEATNNFHQLVDKVETQSDIWYAESIKALRAYNSSLSRYSRNVLTCAAFDKSLSDAYIYKLDLGGSGNKDLINADDEHCTRESHDPSYEAVKKNNDQNLIKAIASHMLKTGHCRIVPDLLRGSEIEYADKSMFEKFILLSDIVREMTVDHNLTLALEWYRTRNSALAPSDAQYSNDDELEFKLHALKFVHILCASPKMETHPILNALAYAQQSFVRFFGHHLNAIKWLTLFVMWRFSTECGDNSKRYFGAPENTTLDSWQSFDRMIGLNHDSSMMQYVQQLFFAFDYSRDDNALLFSNLANEFTRVFCNQLNLLCESALYKVILAGHIFMPSFYKYTTIERRLSIAKEPTIMSFAPRPDLCLLHNAAPVDLAFKLPDGPRFLFTHHPIFVCPILQEQLVPQGIGRISDRTRLDRAKQCSPLVVLNHCQHVALRESVWQLSKKGVDVFKCHYCYMVHRYTEVTDAYFIDY